MIEQIIQMQQQGKPDGEIIQYFREQGISPRDISEALSQAKIKSALGMAQRQDFPDSSEGEMQPSMMPKPPQTYEPGSYQQEQYTQESSQAYPEYSPEVSQESPIQEYAQYQPTTSFDIETINEIVEQVVDEKTDETKKQVSSLIKLYRNLQLEIQRIEQRTSKIESLFNELQFAILNKIGEYGKNLQDVTQELHETQKSFSKIANPLAENMSHLKKISHHQSHAEHHPVHHATSHTATNKTHQVHHQAKPKKHSKSSASFEDYLR